MSTMTLYYNMKRQAPENVKYPIEQQVNCIEDLRQVTAHDHVCAKYEGNYRKKDLFIQADDTKKSDKKAEEEQNVKKDNMFENFPESC